MKSLAWSALRWSGSAIVFVLAASCADTLSGPVPAGPVATMARNSPDPGARYQLLMRTEPLDRGEKTSGWVYPSDRDYQSLNIGPAGVRITFPPGSLTRPVYVTIVAHPGRFIGYEFFPHGVTFAKPVQIQQDLRGTTAANNPSVRATLTGGYLARGWFDVDETTGTASLAELFPVDLETLAFARNASATATFYTDHFSGYTLASGVVPPPPPSGN